MDKKHDKILTLDQFWCLLAKDFPAFSRLHGLPLAASMVDGFNQIFGKLTNHAVADVRKHKIQLHCHRCKNANKDIKNYVYLSHVGMMKGTIEEATEKEIILIYSPNIKTESCSITLFFIPKMIKMLFPTIMKI